MNPRQFNKNTVYNIKFLYEPGSIYFNEQKIVVGQYINNIIAIFNKGFAVPPNDLPAPTAENFDFYVNGILVERLGIVAFTNNITTSTLIINPTILKFSFEESDKIIGIGKFN